MNPIRRRMVLAVPAIAATASLLWRIPSTRAATAGSDFPVSLSQTEWRERLTADEYRILREAGTESPGSSPLLEEKRKGTYVCAGCDQPVFSSRTKFDSGTGWPSFWAPIEGNIGTQPDPGLFGTRTEVHCGRCGGHLGHVFEDGPEPTGLRYCINGIALDFRAETQGAS